MKKIISIIALLLMFAGYSVAGNTVVVSVNEENSAQTHEIAENITLTFQLTDTHIKDGVARVVVDINNNSSNGLLIFDKAYTEKDLKKKRIKFIKSFPGTKGQRSVNPAECIDYMVFLLPSGNTETRSTEICNAVVYDGIKTELTIPFYLVKNKKNSDYSRVMRIIQKEEVTIEFDIHLAEPREYVEMKEQVDTLIAELADLTFCDNPKHSPTLEEQRQVYIDRIDAIKTRIDSVQRDNGWDLTADVHSERRAQTDICKKFQTLESRLYEINIENVTLQDCGNHKVAAPTHYCKYCSYSFQQIMNHLDHIYMKISNSDDPDAVRKEYASDLRRIEACAKRRNGYRKYQKKIEEFIERING